MPVEFPDSTEVCINLDTAEKIGVTIPQDIIDNAAIIIKDGNVAE